MLPDVSIGERDPAGLLFPARDGIVERRIWVAGVGVSDTASMSLVVCFLRGNMATRERDRIPFVPSVLWVTLEEPASFPR